MGVLILMLLVIENTHSGYYKIFDNIYIESVQTRRALGTS